MSVFIWTVLIVFVADTLGKLAILGSGVIPERKSQHVAVNAMINLIFIIWAAVILSGRV